MTDSSPVDTLAALATTDFPADHLPYGVADLGRGPTVVTRIGDHAVDLAALADAGFLSTPRDLLARPSLNALMDAGPEVWTGLRAELLAATVRPFDGAGGHRWGELVAAVDGLTMLLPVEVADYVDFYSSIEHATNLGRLLRPDTEPLLPNWRHIPIGYHGRSGTVVVSGTPISRPAGQRLPAGADRPVWGPTERLDIELELGAILAAPGGVRYDDPEHHLFGVVLVNDWSARDIQAWEYQPLGPFLGKSFATSISSWVVPLAALDPYRVPGPTRQPTPLPYLTRYPGTNFAIDLSVELTLAGSQTSTVITRTCSSALYWTFAQQIQHLRSNGATIRTGDLIATGTISGSTAGSHGSLIEATGNGRNRLHLSDGQERTFLRDGDEVTLLARLGGADGPCLGPCSGRIDPADC